MKKLVSILLIFTLMFSTILPIFAEDRNDLEVVDSNDNGFITLNDGTTLTESEFIEYLYLHSEEIVKVLEPENRFMAPSQNNLILNNTYSMSPDTMPVRMANGGAVIELIEGTWYIPGIGEIVIIGATIYIGGTILIKTGSWIYKGIVKFFENKAQKKIDKIYNSIPTKLQGSDGYVNLDKFTDKVSGKSSYKDPKSDWVIDKDTAGHGGRKWKLKNKKGDRVASLDENGKILGK